MSTSLPRPKVEVVQVENGDKHVVISREHGKAKTYKIEGETREEAVANTVEKVISDHSTAEWLP